MRYFFTAIFLCVSATVFAQQGFLFGQKNDVKIAIGTDTLMHPWVGGLNSPVFSKIDLNHDGVEDLFVFDRETSRSNTFLADNSSGTWQWKPAPQYENLFPEKLDYWVLLRDFDGDGKKDLFTIRKWGLFDCLVVYKNITPAAGILTFGMPRFLKNHSVLPAEEIKISRDALPSITDLDNDGDLDVLFFTGDDLLHYQNISKENFGTADSLWFSSSAQNWGGLKRCNPLMVCHQFAFQNFTSCKTNGTNHSGDANVLALDLDNDADKDLLIGEDMCTNLVRLTNFGTPAAAVMNPASPQTVYPLNTTPASIQNYPAAYFEDVDFDGKKDLLAAPFVSKNRADKVNMSHTAWFYRNTAVSATAAPVFDFMQNNFLQNKMIELGEGARPVFADIDADGDMDLLVGNYADLPKSTQISTVQLFENVGNGTAPVFRLTDSDYMQFSADSLLDIKLQFADMNNDGSSDLIMYYTEGSAAYLRYFPNTAQPNQPFQFTRSAGTGIALDVHADESVFFYDLDADGDLDMLLGTMGGSGMNPPSGALRYYRRMGADAGLYASWKLEDADLGGIPQDLEHYHLQPFIADMNNDGKPDLATVTNSGRLEVYPDILNNLNGTFQAYSNTLFNALRNTYEASRFGLYLHAAYADLDGDQLPEAIIGTGAGGLVYLKNHSTIKLGVQDEIAPVLTLNVFPNPATETLNITSEENIQVSVFDAAGREVQVQTFGFAKTHQLQVSGLKPGVYFLKTATKDFRSAGRTFIVNR